MNENNEAMLNRLARAEGQLRGVQKLIAQGAECEKILQQMTAVRKALDKAHNEMLACLIEEDVLNACESGHSPEASMAHIRQLLSKYT